MIVKCKICGGKGFTHTGGSFGKIFGQDRKPCPACKGAGEFDLKVPQEKLTTCKLCAGRGFIVSPSFALLESTGTVWPTCKGLGVLERPHVGVNNLNVAKTETTHTFRPLDIEYDIAISFAGEDRSTEQMTDKQIGMAMDNINTLDDLCNFITEIEHREQPLYYEGEIGAKIESIFKNR